MIFMAKLPWISLRAVFATTLELKRLERKEESP